MVSGREGYKHVAPPEQTAAHKAQKSAAVFAVRRANYTHRRKGVFNGESIEHLNVGGNVRYRTKYISKTSIKNVKTSLIKLTQDFE